MTRLVAPGEYAADMRETETFDDRFWQERADDRQWEAEVDDETPWLGNIARFHSHPLGSARRLPGRFRQGPRGKHSASLCAVWRP